MVEFLQAFGGKALVQAAWDQLGWALALPLSCPALAGTEQEPAQAVQRLREAYSPPGQDPATSRPFQPPGRHPNPAAHTGPLSQTSPMDATSVATPAEIRPLLEDRQAGADPATVDTTPISGGTLRHQTASEASAGGVHGLPGLGWQAALIPEQQVQCVVAGMRLLVSLLRGHHPWDTVGYAWH